MTRTSGQNPSHRLTLVMKLSKVMSSSTLAARPWSDPRGVNCSLSTSCSYINCLASDSRLKSGDTNESNHGSYDDCQSIMNLSFSCIEGGRGIHFSIKLDYASNLLHTSLLLH